MKLGNLEITGDLVLAPMAGVTDLAFRTICAELGAAVTVTEMVSSRALIYQDKKSISLLHKTPLGVCGAQIFGNDPSVMAEGAALALEASGADFIDINMGCPVGNVVKNGKSKKIRVYKMKPKKGYRRTQGHRQPYTKVEITKIEA